MEPLLAAIISITTLFVVVLLVKLALERWIKKRPLCAICVAVSITWIGLLALYYLGAFADKTLIALLMGQSVLGIFYLLEEKVPENLKVFRLPFLLTLTATGYFLLTALVQLSALLMLGALWLLFFIIYIARDSAARATFARIVECCKRW